MATSSTWRLRVRVRAGVRRPAGDRALLALCGLAALIAVGTLGAVAYEIYSRAQPAISKFGLAFLGHNVWAPALRQFGAAAMLFGSAVSSAIAIIIAAPLGIAIGLYLGIMARPRVRSVVGPIVEMLAAVPSVIMGFWGLAVLAPFVQAHLEPWLHSTLGFIPVFGAPQTVGESVLVAGLVLAMMILPIVCSLTRDLFLTVPQELMDGAEALGATRWEVIRGVVLPTTVSGIGASIVLALGRALGEAIAVLLVIGGIPQIKANLFEPASTLASRITTDIQSPVNSLDISSTYYLAVVLLAMGLATSLAARIITRRFDVQRAIAR